MHFLICSCIYVEILTKQSWNIFPIHKKRMIFAIFSMNSIHVIFKQFPEIMFWKNLHNLQNVQTIFLSNRIFGLFFGAFSYFGAIAEVPRVKIVFSVHCPQYDFADNNKLLNRNRGQLLSHDIGWFLHRPDYLIVVYPEKSISWFAFHYTYIFFLIPKRIFLYIRFHWKEGQLHHEINAFDLTSDFRIIYQLIKNLQYNHLNRLCNVFISFQV